MVYAMFLSTDKKYELINRNFTYSYISTKQFESITGIINTKHSAIYFFSGTLLDQNVYKLPGGKLKGLLEKTQFLRNDHILDRRYVKARFIYILVLEYIFIYSLVFAGNYGFIHKKLKKMKMTLEI